MFGFLKKNLFLGVDVGTSAIKVVELKLTNGKPILTNYAWIDLDLLKDSGADFESYIPALLNKMKDSADFKAKQANFAVPSYGGLITILEFPESIRNELDQAVKFEAYKYIPAPIEDVVLSWDIVNGKVEKENKEKEALEPNSGKIEVMLVAASKNKVLGCESLAKLSGLNLMNIEIESFSMARSLIGNDTGNFLIVDIGSRICNIALVERGVIKMNRNIDAGGKDLTRVIAKSMEISEERAEKMKTSGKNFFSRESEIIFPPLETIIKEIKRALGAYYKNDGNKLPIDAVILSGGTANFTGIDKYFSNMLGAETIVGNPFSRLEYDKKLEPVLEKMKTQFSVAIGLALKGEMGK